MATKYLSSEPVTHLFDQLPTDMIYYEIFPYLDYDSRVTANLLLPQEDRLRTPLRKDAALEFQVEIDGISVNGIDIIKWDDEGRIVEFKVLIRPLKAINLIHQKMALMLQANQ